MLPWVVAAMNRRDLLIGLMSAVFGAVGSNYVRDRLIPKTIIEAEVDSGTRLTWKGVRVTGISYYKLKPPVKRARVYFQGSTNRESLAFDTEDPALLAEYEQANAAKPKKTYTIELDISQDDD